MEVIQNYYNAESSLFKNLLLIEKVQTDLLRKLSKEKERSSSEVENRLFCPPKAFLGKFEEVTHTII